MPPPNTPEEALPAPPGEEGAMENRQDRGVSTSPRLQPSSPGLPPPQPSSHGFSASSPSQLPTKATETMAPTPVDYQALTYLDPIDDTLICPICRTPFHDPVTTKSCGHTFCLACLHRATAINPSCPIDRLPLTAAPDQLCTTRIVSHQLDRLRISCPNRGCGATMTRASLPDHVARRCDGALVSCPDEACEKLVARADAARENGCLHRKMVRCHCDKFVAAADLEEHYDLECEGRKEACEGCGEKMIRHRMADHVARSCAEAEVACRWNRYGCPTRLRRREIPDHERRGCVYEAIGRLERDRAADRAVIDDLSGRLAAMEVRTRRDDGPSSPGSRGWRPAPGGGFIPVLDLDEQAPSPRPQQGYSREWESPEDYMLAQFERMETKIEDLRKTVTELDGRHSMMLLNEAMPLKEQIAELRSNLGVIGMHTTWLMNVQRQSRGQQRGGGGPVGMAASGVTAGAGASGGTGAGRGGATADDENGGRQALQPRRLSDGRGENPPRL